MRNVIILCLLVSFVYAQEFVANYDESKVPDYTLPELLVCEDGEKVETIEQWQNKRRPEILELFQEHVYGYAPEKFRSIKYKVMAVDKLTMNGLATRKQVTIYLTGKKNGPKMDVLIYLPNNVEKPVPLFSTLNFYGNHAITDDPAVPLADSWLRNNEDYGITENRATEASRGARSFRWEIEYVLKQGYGLASIYYGDIDPDRNDFSDGIHPEFYKKGQTQPAKNEWGSIAAWAWGLSRAMDYYENDDDIDESRIIVMGHSRLGKTSLWAGATDERYAMVVANNSGCGGAALSRREFGETVARINTSFPHWFCDNFVTYNDRVNELPVDQHMLIALCAPRPVYVASAQEDRWADPRGEFLSSKNASPVYELFGLQGLPADEMPDVNEPVWGTIGYHYRTGGHDVKPYDWQQYCAFADQYLK